MGWGGVISIPYGRHWLGINRRQSATNHRQLVINCHPEERRLVQTIQGIEQKPPLGCAVG